MNTPFLQILTPNFWHCARVHGLDLLQSGTKCYLVSLSTLFLNSTSFYASTDPRHQCSSNKCERQPWTHKYVVLCKVTSESVFSSNFFGGWRIDLDEKVAGTESLFCVLFLYCVVYSNAVPTKLCRINCSLKKIHIFPFFNFHFFTFQFVPPTQISLCRGGIFRYFVYIPRNHDRDLTS